MSNQSFYRALGVGAAALAAAGGLTAASASAAPAPVRLTVVGSNTTQEVMGAVTKKFNSSTVAKSGNIVATNIYAQPPDPGTVAPSDSKCNGGTAITYIQETNPGPNQRTAPNGSGAGRTALATSVTNGDSCVSVARSSSPGSASDPAGTQGYAYAIDAVSWSAKIGGNAPANLSMTQLESVYNCTVTNWSQVGGKSGDIVRYFPQVGSGSGSFFAGVLGFDPRVVGGANTCATPAIQIEENEATSIAPGDVPNAVMIYSGGAWAAQANKVDPDLRNGFNVRSINNKGVPVVKQGAKYVLARFVTEANVEPANYNPTSNTAVQGVRNLFNFINTNSVDYAAAAKFVGARSALCTGKDLSIISMYGFKGLPKCVFQF